MKNTLAIKISIFLNFIVFAILLNSVGTVIQQVINSYGVSKFDASSLEQYKDLTIAIVSFLVGSFLPKIGYKKGMLIALALVTITSFIMPFTDAFWHTKLMFAVVGLSFAIVKVAAYSTVGLITKDQKEHSSFMNTMEGVFMIGVLIGYWLFAAYINPDDPGNLGWLDVFWLVGALSAAAFVLLLFSPLDESELKEKKESKLTEDFGEMLALIVKPLVYVFVISAFIYVLIEQGIGTWLPTFNNEVLNLPADMSVQVTSILAASAAAGRLLAGRILLKVDWLRFLSISLVICGVLILVTLPLTYGLEDNEISGWSSAPLAAFVFPLLGFFLAPVYPAINSVVLSGLPKQMHSAMTGLIVVFSALGGTTGSRITGFVFENFNGQTAFYMYLVPISLLTGLLFIFKKLSKSLTPQEK